MYFRILSHPNQFQSISLAHHILCLLSELFEYVQIGSHEEAETVEGTLVYGLQR
jgi:hypothetical protein